MKKKCWVIRCGLLLRCRMCNMLVCWVYYVYDMLVGSVSSDVLLEDCLLECLTNKNIAV